MLHPYFSRYAYGYVGSMDNAYGNDVYGKDPIESVSMIISFPREVAGVHTIYMYFVKKSKAELTATAKTIFYTTFIGQHLFKTKQPQKTGICVSWQTALPTW